MSRGANSNTTALPKLPEATRRLPASNNDDNDVRAATAGIQPSEGLHESRRAILIIIIKVVMHMAYICW